MLASVKSKVFCPPPLGKPDPTQPRPSEGRDTRGRIVQSGFKDDTCWFRIFDMLRERYKAPNTQDLPERKFERTVSSMRKAIAAHNHSIPVIINLAIELYKEEIKLLTKDKISTPLGQKLIGAIDEKFPSKVSLSSICPEFLNQDVYKNLYDYLVYLTVIKSQNIYLQFFASLNVDPATLLEYRAMQDPLVYLPCLGNSYTHGRGWEDIKPYWKTFFLARLAMHRCAEGFNLKISSWHPQKSFEALKEELQERGPLIVDGFYGPSCYLGLPKKLERQIEGRDIYGWSKDAPKIKNPSTSHTILLVGAEKTNKRGFVYYIDPKDDSDPLHPEKQLIYCISYERLVSKGSIRDLDGFVRNTAPATTGYAWYRQP